MLARQAFFPTELSPWIRQELIEKRLREPCSRHREQAAHLTSLRRIELGTGDLGGTEDGGRDVTRRAVQDRAWRCLFFSMRMITGELR